MIITEPGKDVYTRRTLVENVINMIFRGTLNNGDFLPSIRKMSKRYQISRNSVVAAYKELESLGFIEGRERSCYLVISKNLTPPAGDSVFLPERKEEKEPAVSTAPDLFELTNRLTANCNAILPAHFMRRYFSEGNIQRHGSSSKDMKRLKGNLARYVKITRGADVETETMLVMQGQQEALALIAWFGKQQSVQPSIVLEDPVSPLVLQLFTRSGYEIIRVRVGKEGLDAASLPERHVDFIYSSPTNQFPSGAKMSAANRKRLLQWSQRYSVTVIESDACFMLGFGESIIPPLCEHYPAANVIYLYSLAEFIGNSINLSLMSLPAHLLTAFQQLKPLFACDSPAVMHNVVNHFLESSHLLKYLSTTLQTVQRKYELAASGLQALEPDIDSWGLMHAGYFSFTCDEERLSVTPNMQVFVPLTLFCQAPALWQPNRFLYPTGSLSMAEIKIINKNMDLRRY